MATRIELIDAVGSAALQLQALLRHRESFGEAGDEIEDLVSELRDRLRREELVVAVVGEKKAGKSTFLNAVMGEAILGVAIRECTGTVTRIRRGPRRYRAIREGGVEEGACLEEVAALTDLKTAGVLELELWVPSEVLPADLVLLDTPGVNTDHEENQARAWAAIEKEADGCILLSDLQQALPRSTLDFLERVRQQVPEVYLMLTKVDRAWDNAEDVGGDPAEEVEEARRVGVRRFAEQVGLGTDEVVAWAVAAQSVLDGTRPYFARRFAEDLGELVDRLARDRDLILVRRAARAAEQAIELVDAACDQAEARYSLRAEQLESQRIPDPDAFLEETLAEVDVDEAVDRAVEAMESVWLRELGGWHGRWDDRIAEVGSRRALTALGEDLEQSMPTALEIHAGRALNAGQAVLEEAWSTLATAALGELVERYRLVEAARAGDLGMVDVEGLHQAEVRVGIEGLVGEDRGPRTAFSVGAGLGALGLGLLIGAPVVVPLVLASGAFLAVDRLITPLDSLRKKAAVRLKDSVVEARDEGLAQLRAARPQLESMLRLRLRRQLVEELTRFHEVIDAGVRDHSAAVAVQKARLQDLWRLRHGLQAQREILASGLREPAGSSG
ncbi:MAG TPA: dynamin family protein [Myxococcota bacterium]|nr:dynamin family protein [Myxococcota bacterium]